MCMELNCHMTELRVHQSSKSIKLFCGRMIPSRVTSKIPLPLPRNMLLGIVQGRLTGLAEIWRSPLFGTTTCSHR